MAVFEDDVAVKYGNRSALDAFISKCHRLHCDVAYLGEVPHFFSNHAQWITPAGAAKLLNATGECLGSKTRGLTVDRVRAL